VFLIVTVKLKKGWKLLLLSGGFWPFFVIHEPNKSVREKSGEPGRRGEKKIPPGNNALELISFHAERKRRFLSVDRN
jgi:hypothetical protein